MDFRAWKTIEEIKLKNDFDVTFDLHLLGECKRSDTHDFFAFRSEYPISIGLLNYPLRFHREPIPNIHHAFFDENFKFPCIAERIVEVNAAKYTTRNNDNYQDRMTYGACETLANACKYFRDDFARYDAFERGPPFSDIFNDYEATARTMHEKDQDEIIDKLVSEHSDKIHKAFGFFRGSLAVPIIVLDDNRGLVETVLLENGEVSFQRQLDVVLYPHYVREISQARSFEDVLLVTICKYESLSAAIRILEEGTRSVLKRFKQGLQEDPDLVAKAMISAEIESRRLQLSRR